MLSELHRHSLATCTKGDSWRRLVILLAQLRGDRRVETLLKEKHPELLQVAEAWQQSVNQNLDKVFMRRSPPVTAE